MSGGILGFTGTRHGCTYGQLDTARMILRGFRSNGIIWQHNGDCIGADRQIGEMWAADSGKLHLWPSDIPRLRANMAGDIIEKPKPPLSRNRDIVNICTILLATPGEMTEQPRGGTWSTIRYARMLSRPIVIIFLDGKVKLENYAINASTPQAIEAGTAEVCTNCAGCGWVCENHADKPWSGLANVVPCCGGAGAPCSVCGGEQQP